MADRLPERETGGGVRHAADLAGWSASRCKNCSRLTTHPYVHSFTADLERCKNRAWVGSGGASGWIVAPSSGEGASAELEGASFCSGDCLYSLLFSRGLLSPKLEDRALHFFRRHDTLGLNSRASAKDTPQQPSPHELGSAANRCSSPTPTATQRAMNAARHRGGGGGGAFPQLSAVRVEEEGESLDGTPIVPPGAAALFGGGPGAGGCGGGGSGGRDGGGSSSSGRGGGGRSLGHGATSIIGFASGTGAGSGGGGVGGIGGGGAAAGGGGPGGGLADGRQSAQLAQQFDEDGGAGGGGGGGTLHKIREGMAQPADLPVRLDLFLPSAGAVQGGRGGRQLRGPARTISLEADRTLERMHQY